MFEKKNNLKKDSSRIYKRLMITFMITTVIFGTTLGVGVYMNYNYLAFKVLIAGNYIYPEALSDIYGQHLSVESVEGSENYFKHFDNAVISVFTEKIRQVNNDRYTYLYTPPQYTLSKETKEAVAKEASVHELSPDWVYIRLPNISVYTKGFLYENKELLNRYDNIIIDLQSNYGGELEALYDMSELFLDKGMVIGREVARLSLFTKTIKAKNERFFDFKNIVFLQNQETASAAEGFIMSLRENLNNVTVAGTQSFGKGIGQITMPLKRGYAVKATVILIETPSGNTIHNVGVIPDIEYENEDNIIDFVIEHFKLP